MIRVCVQQPTLAQYRVPVFRELARRPDIDLQVVYGSRRDLPNARPDGFDTRVYPLRFLRLGRQVLAVHRPQWSHASRRMCDVLVLTWNIRYLALIPGLCRAAWNGVPTVLWGHGYSKRERRIGKWMRHRVARMASAVMVYNETTAKFFADEGFPSERLFVALNCLDQAPIQAARTAWLAEPERLETFRRQQGLNGPVILFVSRLDRANRVDLLLEAVRILRNEMPEVQVVVIGAGEPEGTRLRTLAREGGLAECVRFAGAIYDEEALAPWYLSAAVLCYPENIGLSLLHAFGYGVPVVTCDDRSRQNPEIEALRHGENGLLYQTGSAANLASTLRQLLKNGGARQAMGEAARRTVVEQFSLARMVDGMERAIRFAAGQRSPGR